MAAPADQGLLFLNVGMSALSSSAAPPRRHGLFRFPAVLARFITVAFNQPANPILQVGLLLVGVAFQPTHNREWGSGRQIVDTGSREPLLGGGFGIGEGVRKAVFRWNLGDLTDAEVESLYDMALDRGETRPILVVEDPDATTGLNERIHYGLFDRFDAYERLGPGRTTWALSVTQWV